MLGSLDASNFSGSVTFYDNEFKKILSKIAYCYQLMKSDKVELENDENKIRDTLVTCYVNNPEIKRKIQLEYFIFPEVPETKTGGRADIRIHNPNSFMNQNEEYYIIECKRLDNTNTKGTTGLNAEYIKEGINRFITKKYSSYYRVNGMIGFIVEDLKIDENIKNINAILTNSFSSIVTKQEITQDSFIDDFEYHYHSVHTDKDNKDLKIYHLMFDFMGNIKN
jgi:hypothetical protein